MADQWGPRGQISDRGAGPGEGRLRLDLRGPTPAGRRAWQELLGSGEAPSLQVRTLPPPHPPPHTPYPIPHKALERALSITGKARLRLGSPFSFRSPVMTVKMIK